MARLLPSRTEPEPDPSPRVVGLDDEAADDLLSALSSSTAREILAALHDEPANPAALADSVDTSLQNVQYHLERLESAGAVEVVDTVYSEKGREMSVYAPADRPLVVVATDGEEQVGLAAALKRLLGGAAVVGLVSLLAQFAIAGLPVGAKTGGGDGGFTAQSTESTRIAAESAASGVPPGLLVFLGGLTALLAWFVVWYARRR
ncbi:MAG: ArsR/SmtB family transcription factor [Haloquadratum sp.]